ncbi:hypothetical protein [Aquimarina rhabdastrellae]
MKNILNFKGIKTLSKSEQKQINGAAVQRPWCGGPKRCCINTASGVFCDYGYCYGNRCEWA